MAQENNKEYIVIGAGGHAGVILDCLHALNLDVKGCVDAHKKPDELVLGKYRILGDDSVLDILDPSGVLLVNGIGSIGDAKARRDVFARFKDKGFEFATLCHPAAYVSDFSSIAEGSVILAGAVVGANARIGRNVIINTKASIDHDCVIEDHVHIAPGVTISGGVIVQKQSHIGTGACVVQGIRIGPYSFIRAGEAVKRDVIDEAGEKL